MGISLNIPQSINASPGAATFEQDMLFDIPFVADRKQIGEYRLRQTDHSNKRANSSCVNYDYKFGENILIRKDGILYKAESIWRKDPWTTPAVHLNESIRIQCRTKSERINT